MSAGSVFHPGKKKEKQRKQERLENEGVLSRLADLHANTEMKMALEGAPFLHIDG